MSYRVEFQREARKELAALPADARTRVSLAIASLAVHPRPSGMKKMRGRARWRIRVGSYRVIYTVFDTEQLIIIERIARRTTHTYD